MLGRDADGAETVIRRAPRFRPAGVVQDVDRLHHDWRSWPAARPMPMKTTLVDRGPPSAPGHRRHSGRSTCSTIWSAERLRLTPSTPPGAERAADGATDLRADAGGPTVAVGDHDRLGLGLPSGQPSSSFTVPSSLVLPADEPLPGAEGENRRPRRPAAVGGTDRLRPCRAGVGDAACRKPSRGSVFRGTWATPTRLHGGVDVGSGQAVEGLAIGRRWRSGLCVDRTAYQLDTTATCYGVAASGCSAGNFGGEIVVALSSGGFTNVPMGDRCQSIGDDSEAAMKAHHQTPREDKTARAGAVDPSPSVDEPAHGWREADEPTKASRPSTSPAVPAGAEAWSMAGRMSSPDRRLPRPATGPASPSWSVGTSGNCSTSWSDSSATGRRPRDVFQETFLQIHQSAENFGHPAALPPMAVHDRRQQGRVT